MLNISDYVSLVLVPLSNRRPHYWTFVIFMNKDEFFFNLKFALEKVELSLFICMITKFMIWKKDAYVSTTVIWETSLKEVGRSQSEQSLNYSWEQQNKCSSGPCARSVMICVQDLWWVFEDILQKRFCPNQKSNY